MIKIKFTSSSTDPRHDDEHAKHIDIYNSILYVP